MAAGSVVSFLKSDISMSVCLSNGVCFIKQDQAEGRFYWSVLNSSG